MRTTVKVIMQKNAESGRKILEFFVLFFYKSDRFLYQTAVDVRVRGWAFLVSLSPSNLIRRKTHQTSTAHFFFLFSFPSLKPGFICHVWSHCYPSTLCRDREALSIETVLRDCHLTASISPALDLKSQDCTQLLQSSHYDENLSSPISRSAIFSLFLLHDLKNAGASASAKVPCGIAISCGGRMCSAQSLL